MQKFDLKALFVGVGVIWGGYLFIAALLEMAKTNVLMFNSQSFSVLTQFYPGVTPDVIGAVIGLVWGFFCAGIPAAIFGLIYNKLLSMQG